MSAWSFAAVGDVFIKRLNPTNAFHGSSDLLHKLDLVFGNCEGAFTDNPHVAPSAGFAVFAPESNGRGLADAGFDVMSVANNHIVDAGHQGLADTLSLLHSQGIKTVGAGASETAARAAAIVEHNGVKIGFLGFASVFPVGYEARGSTPGLSQMRVHSFIEPLNHHEAGVPPQVRTIPDPQDVELLRSLIEDLRRKVDVVIVSHHWGQFRPVFLTEYERLLGHASIDAGADIVLGHHHHFLRGVELYRGKPIYYGIGHFVFDAAGIEMTGWLRKELGEYAMYPREGYPYLPFHPDARMTMVACCEFEGGDLRLTGFFPCLINSSNHAMPLHATDPQAQRVVDYVTHISAEVGLKTLYGPVSEKNGFAFAACS